jgi:hypothetical protein
MPHDVVGWKEITDRAAELMEQRVGSGTFSVEQVHHRRAQEPYPSISRGVSHGGGQTVRSFIFLYSFCSDLLGTGGIVQQPSEHQADERFAARALLPTPRRLCQL